MPYPPSPSSRSPRCLLGVWLLLVVLAAPAMVWGGPSSGQLGAYAALVLADEAHDEGSWAEAHEAYGRALKLYEELAEEQPAWHPEIVKYRIRYCQDRQAGLAPRLVAAPAASGGSGRAQRPSGTNDLARGYAEKALALAGENTYLRRRIRGLEEELDQLSAAGPGGEADEEAADNLREALANVQAEADRARAELAAVQADAGNSASNLEAAVASARLEHAEATARAEQTRAELIAYQAEAKNSVSNLQAALASARLEHAEAMQANLDLVRQLEAAAAEHLRLSMALKTAGLEVPVTRLPPAEEPDDESVDAPVRDDVAPVTNRTGRTDDDLTRPVPL